MSAASVSAEELVLSLRRRGVTLPAEIGTFVALEACDAMLTGGPRELAGLAHVRVSEQGTTSISGPACDDEPGARALHGVLVSLLEAAGPSLPPALARLVEAGSGAQQFTLRALRDELEAALVPLNRNASRRVLARFARDAAQPLPDAEDVDRALDSLLGAGEEPANDVASRPSHERLGGESPLQVDLFEGLELDPDDGSFTVPKAREERRRPAPRPALDARSDSLSSFHSRVDELEREQRLGSRKLLLGFALVALAVAIVTVVISLRRQLHVASEPSPVHAPAPSEQLLRGELIVRVAERDAQILRFVGRAPVTVENLPVGAAHEFVATAPGHLPARVLIPTDAEWEGTADGARYEVALQLPDGAGHAGDELALGPSLLTKQASGAVTRLGSVRVVATPRGARVYQLLGFGPKVEVHDLPLGGDEELLIYRPGSNAIIRAVTASDFVAQGEKRVADVAISLPKR